MGHAFSWGGELVICPSTCRKQVGPQDDGFLRGSRNIRLVVRKAANYAGGTVDGIGRARGLEDAGMAIAGEDGNLITELFGDQEISVIRRNYEMSGLFARGL